jgi:hypothetical protein
VFEAELKQISVGKLDTTGVKTAVDQVKALSAEFEKAVKSGDMGQIDTSGITRAITEASQLQLAFEKAAGAANNIKMPSGGGPGSGNISAIIGQVVPGGLGTLGGAFAGGFTATAVIAGLKELGQELDAVARRGAVMTQLRDVLESYTKSVGTNTDAMIGAAKKASAGTIAEYELILNANRALQFEVAKTPQQFAQLVELSTALGRAQGISDTQALEYLTTGLARESRLILDNLGLIINVSKANEDYAKSIGKTADQLTTAERKQALLAEAYNQGAVAIEANRQAFDSAATQYERFDANAQNLKDSLGELASRILSMPVAKAAGALQEYNEKYFKGGVSDDTLLRRRAELQAEIAKIEANGGQSNVLGMQFDDDLIGRAERYRDAIAEIDILLRAMKSDEPNPITGPSLEDFTQGQSTKKLTFSPSELSATDLIAAESEKIEAALLARAKQAVATMGADSIASVTAQMESVRSQMNAAIDDMIERGLSDPQQISFESTALQESLLAAFDVVNQVDFSAFSGAFAGLNQSFGDFLPAVASAREELAALSEEIAFTGSMTAEQAAQFDYLASIAYSVGDAGSQLNGVVNELGGAFLESNSYAAALVEQLFLAEAAFRNGQISAGTYAGMTAALTGNLLTLAQGAGIATSAIWQLNQAQADMSNLPGYAAGQQVGGSISQRIATQQAASGREQNRREMERYNAAVARQQESSARRAGKALEDGAKKASQELKSALDKVPGLFGTTQVTEQDMKDAELGVYQEKADEYLRRLRDEVVNGKQWEDVSIEEARAGLERAGLEVGNTAEQTLSLLEKAMNDSSLYSAAENIPIFINEEAVKYAQDLQAKSEQGRKNIYEYFGVVVDDATSAATGGGGAAPAPVAPPKLVDIDPLTEGLQTGLDEYVNANGQVIKEQVANAKALFFDPAQLFGTGGKTNGMGPMTNPAVTVTADPTAQALVPYITGQQQATIQMQATSTAFGPQPQDTAPTSGAVALAPTIDGEALQTELDKLTPTVGVQLHVTVEEIALFKQTITGIITPTVGVKLETPTETLTTWATGIETNTPSPAIEARINTTVGTLSDWVLWVETNAPKPNVGVLLHTTVEEIGLYKDTIGSIVKPTVEVGLTLGQSEQSVSAQLATAITADVATNANMFTTPGIVVAQLIMAAILDNMQGQQQQGQGGGEGGGGPVAMALATNLMTQFATAAPMFTAAGIVPAQIVEAGFKGHTYTGMADNLQASVMQSISSKAGDFVAAGGYIGGWIQQGINQSFNAEINLTFATNAGASWGTAFMKGALTAIGGGALVQSISDKVITDLATELEK